VHKDQEHKNFFKISKWYLLEKNDGGKNDLGKKVKVWNVIMQRMLPWNVCLPILINCNLVLHVKTKINSYNLLSYFCCWARKTIDGLWKLQIFLLFSSFEKDPKKIIEWLSRSSWEMIDYIHHQVLKTNKETMGFVGYDVLTTNEVTNVDKHI
jgi:hypothetical protein